MRPNPRAGSPPPPGDGKWEPCDNCEEKTYCRTSGCVKGTEDDSTPRKLPK